MSDALEKLQHELEAAQRALAEAEARCARHDAEHQAITKDLEDTRNKIEQAHQEWMGALDVVEDPIFMHDKDFHILRCNRAYQQCAGIPFKRIIGQPYYEVFPKTHAPLPSCLRAMGKTMAEENEEEVLVGDTLYRSRSFSIHDGQGGYLYSVHTLEDITARKRAEEMLIASHDLLQTVVENAPLRIFWKDTESRYLGCNTAFARDAGMSRPVELLGKDDSQMGWREQAERYRADDKRAMDSGTPKLGFEEPQTTPDGRTTWLRTSKVPLRGVDGKVFGVLGIYEDITEHRQAEERLKLFRTLLDNSSDAVEVIDPVTSRFIDINDTECRDLGYSREELLSMRVTDIDPAFDVGVRKMIDAQVLQSASARIESVHRRKDGSTFPVEISLKSIELDKTYGLAIVRDITERKRMEKELRESEARYRRITEGLTDYQYTVRIENGRPVETTQSPACVTVTGYTAEEHAADPHLWIQMVVPEDRELVMQHVQQILAGKDVSPIEHRITRKDGETRWISDTIILFRDASGKLLSYDGVIKDITERKKAEKDLHELFMAALQSLASAIEAKSPWTRGHSERVADYAVKIGVELGLMDGELEKLHVAALLHDIGKIGTYDGILDKSGELTDAEYELIKRHPGKGAEMLAPIRQMQDVLPGVRGHHERFDGTGYPDGFKGEDIPLQARILAVADTFDSMTAERPYRTTPGKVQALEEIQRNAGIQFDPKVVEAFLRVEPLAALPHGEDITTGQTLNGR